LPFVIGNLITNHTLASNTSRTTDWDNAAPDSVKEINEEKTTT